MTALHLSLAHLTVVDAAPPVLVEAAAHAGFRSTGIRLLPARPGEQPWPMQPGGPMLRETLARLRHLGVRVNDVEVVRLRPDGLPAGLDAALDAAAELGARWVMVNCDDDDPARAAGQLHAVADAAARRGLRTGVEFMAYTAMASLEQACGLVRRAGHAGAAVVIDSLHLFRSGAGAADLEGRPEVARDFMQINDAWVARIPVSLAEEGRAHRLLPGEGDLPVHTLVARLDAGATLAVESPCALRRDTLTPLQRAELAMRTTRRWAQAHALPLSDASEPIT